jgi:hypothetical protein
MSMNRLNCSGLSGVGFGLRGTESLSRGWGACSECSSLLAYPLFLSLFRLLLFPFQKLVFRSENGISVVNKPGFLCHLGTSHKIPLPRFPLPPILKAILDFADHDQQNYTEDNAESYFYNEHHFFKRGIQWSLT